jgi:hypothetical protein
MSTIYCRQYTVGKQMKFIGVTNNVADLLQREIIADDLLAGVERKRSKWREKQPIFKESFRRNHHRSADGHTETVGDA